MIGKYIAYAQGVHNYCLIAISLIDLSHLWNVTHIPLNQYSVNLATLRCVDKFIHLEDAKFEKHCCKSLTSTVAYILISCTCKPVDSSVWMPALVTPAVCVGCQIRPAFASVHPTGLPQCVSTLSHQWIHLLYSVKCYSTPNAWALLEETLTEY